MKSSNHTWRLIIHPPAPGAWNMAVDEALQEVVGREEALPVLRLYAWSPPCLSLGYTQPYLDVDQAAISRLNWDIVRRPTGGRAILHTDELTYSVSGPQKEPILSGSVLESYRRLSTALLNALHSFGIPAEAKPEPGNPPAHQGNRSGADPVCFEVPSNYEITVNGRKLIGSAQSRRLDAILQHGSLPLSGDLSRINLALAYPDEASRQEASHRLLVRATTVERALNRLISWESMATAFVGAFQETFNLQLEEVDLSPDERRRAEELVHEKYQNSAWTQRL